MTEAHAQEERYACGARAAFVLLRLLGRDVEYESVCTHAPPSEQGCSLKDVQSALAAHDVDCVVLRLQLTDLSSTQCPFILHTLPMNMAPMHSSPKGDSPVGHFILVTGVDEIGLHTYDPVTTLNRHWRWPSFADQWGGYAVVPRRAANWIDQPLLCFLILMHLLVSAFVVAVLWTKR